MCDEPLITFLIAPENQTFLSKLVDPQVWMPVAMAFVGYFFQAWIRMILSRKEQSRRAVTYLGEIAEEVESGNRLLHYWYEHGGQTMSFCGHVPKMTREAWKGFSNIVPDDVYQRILNVAFHTHNKGARELRSHLKNYYVCICSHYDRIVDGKMPFNAGYYREDVDGADMVKNLVYQCRDMMQKNSERIFWPW